MDSYDKLVGQVNRAFEYPEEKATLFFGILDSGLLSNINRKIPNLPKSANGYIFKPKTQYSIAATLDSIRHLTDKKSSMTKKDVIDYLDRFADTIVDNDSVTFNTYIDSRRQRNNGLLFKKAYSDGIIESFDIVSNKKKSLSLITIYMDNADYTKKKSANAPLLPKTVAHTPEAWDSQTSQTKDTTPSAESQEEISGSILYSLRSEAKVKANQEASSAIEKENAKLKEDNENLKRLLKLQKTVTHGKMLNESSIISNNLFLILPSHSVGIFSLLYQLYIFVNICAEMSE